VGRDGLAALAAALLGEGRALHIVARGGSMSPFIGDGETVRLEPLVSPPRPGDVALCRGPGGALTLHRVVRVMAAGVVTRGDAAAGDDPAVPLADVLGRAVAVSGRQRLHLRPACGRHILRGHALRGGVLAAGPLRRLVRGIARLAARLP
jgi:hypothetical protein